VKRSGFHGRTISIQGERGEKREREPTKIRRESGGEDVTSKKKGRALGRILAFRGA